MSFLRRIFNRKPLPSAVSAAITPTVPKSRKPVDVLDSLGPQVDDELVSGPSFEFRTADDYPSVGDFNDMGKVDASGDIRVGDSAKLGELRSAVKTFDGLTGQGTPDVKRSWSAYTVPEQLMNWYGSQGFIGYQSCAIIAQHWLVDKACTMPGEDAVRNGYELSIADENNEQYAQLDLEDIISKLKERDEEMGMRDKLVEFSRFRKIYGIRIAIFDVESDDPDYYAKPFNIDGVTKGSYKGIKQVDPYWTMPVMSGTTTDPTSLDFYIPQFWIIGGKKYHVSHLVIGRESQPADILKPTYVFGGIPLTQRIYERVYASERTANEGPLLAMTKRLNVLHVDLAKSEAQPKKFLARLMKWIELRDNFGVKTVGTNEVVEQFDTTLADLDTVIMTQYQLVCAQARVPATKMMGTSPKGFNSNGTGEEKNYHEELETEQMRVSPLLNRHHMLSLKSEFGVSGNITVAWNRVDSFSAEELAQLNYLKAQTAQILVNDIAAISPEDERNRLKNDLLSGYNHLSDESAEVEMGGTPDNQAKLTTAEAKETTAQAPTPAPGAPGATPPQAEGDGIDAHVASLHGMLAAPGASNMSEDVLGHIRNLKNMLSGGNFDGAMEHVNALKALVGSSKLGTLGSVATGAQGTQGLMERLYAMNQRVGDTNQTGLAMIGSGSKYSRRNMPKVKVGRLTVVVENPRGSLRSGATVDGIEWCSQMPHHYGYINGVLGADGDELDAFIGPNPQSGLVFVINQVEPTTGQFDEHKVMLGFESMDEARDAYTQSYQDGWTGLESIHEMPMEDFRVWCRSGMTEEPFIPTLN